MTLTLNPHILGLRSAATGELLPPDFSRPVGLHDGAPVTIEYDLAALRGAPYVAADQPGMWRYARLLPVHGVAAGYADDVGVARITPCPTLADELDCEVFLEHEGSNPTGSFKDRGLAVGIALGVACGARRFCLPTQGNAGVAAACFSMRAGIEPALVYMPESHRGSIYAVEAEHFGAEVRFFGAHIGEAGRRMRDVLAQHLASGAYVDISTFFEPGRLEGKKTMGLDIANTFGPDALPHVILYPTGGGTGLVGIWKAFAELRGLGVLADDARLPRMVAVQSSGCAPVVEAFHAGRDRVDPVVSRGTVADGLDVPSAIMGPAILRVLRASGGGAVAIDDEHIVLGFRRLGNMGVSASFEGAAAVAALASLRDEGSIAAGERVLILNTASHLVALSSPGATRYRRE